MWTGVTDHPDAGERNLLAVLVSEHVVRSLSLDLREVECLPVGGLIVTARRRARDVVSRYFAPVYGIPEDPATRSAHCTIGHYWRDQLGTTLFAEQASPRGGRLTLVATDDGRVHLARTARTAATGPMLRPMAHSNPRGNRRGRALGKRSAVGARMSWRASIRPRR